MFENIKNAFAGFGLRDAVDILLLAAVLFTIFTFVLRVRNGVLPLIIIGVSVTAILCDGFGLSACACFFIGILQAGVILLAVVYQPEIRETLERISQHRLFRRKEKSGFIREVNEMLDSVCSAVKDLSATKTGALIVITRNVRPDEIVRTGIPLNADVSSFLLRNIFFNKAPLHDGAVIINDNRILAAGCLLPLSRRSDVDANLGTRHRAALGMSEVSDALTIVVSEETGIVSVAYDNALIRNYTSGSLKSFLKKQLGLYDSRS